MKNNFASELENCRKKNTLLFVLITIHLMLFLKMHRNDLARASFGK